MDASRADALDLAFAATGYLQTLLDRLGKLELVDGRLLAGGVDLHNNTELVEKVKSELGFGCSIFQGDIRIATTAHVAVAGTGVADGEALSVRAVGRRANDETVQQVYRCGEPHKGITRILNAEWVIVYVPLRDHQDKIVGMLAAYRMLSDFLHDLKLLDAAPEALLLHSADGRIADVNRTACDMLAMSKQELLGKSLPEFTATAADALRSAWGEISDEPIRIESFWRRSDVFAFPVELTVGRAEVMGKPLLLTIARDFTDQHRAREQLRSLNAQLAQSEKMAALGKLVAGVTHDMNTPLGVLRSGQQTVAKAAEKLRKTLGEHHAAALETAGVDRALRVIETTIDTVGAGVDRIDAVVRRLRSFARLDQGSLQDVDLRASVDEILALVAHRVPASVTVTTELVDLPRLRCYPAQLNQLIMNLVGNAIDAVGDQGTIAVRATADGRVVELVVEDDGVGIAGADLPNIFNPGFTTKGVGFGGGLGLAIAYQVAELHGGSIAVKSTLGTGACFTTSLPLMGVRELETQDKKETKK